ncbi:MULTISPECIES: hypothetical protein [Halostella]|uniref:DUF7504 family protein n=1 Tax=Halostella TaxID=1843185 RepID=UPI0010816AE4|nr:MULTISPECIES: hypothetical protein [Halostella]
MHEPDPSSEQSFLVAGPSGTGQRELAFDALSQCETVVAVAPEQAATTVGSWYRGRTAELVTIDPAEGGGGSMGLSELGVSVSEAIEEANDAGVWVAIDELPGLVPECDLFPLFAFFDLLHRRIADDGTQLVCTVDTHRLRPDELRTLEQLFDCRRVTRSDRVAEQTEPR